MTLPLLVAAVALTPLINTGQCLDTEKNVKLNEEVYQGLTDRELVLTLLKRIDDLEEWNQKQQKEIDYLQVTNRKQVRKQAVLERILRRRYKKPVEPTDDPESSPKDNLSETYTEPGVEDYQVTVMSLPGQLVRKPQQEKHIFRRRAIEHMRVAFYATLSAHLIGLGSNQPVEFDQVATNVGNAYNPHTGAFTAPFAGIYVFSTTLMAHSSDQVHLILTKNAIRFARMFSGGTESPYASSSHTFVLQLQKNDDIAIRNDGTGHDVNGDEYSSFSGFLLYPDDEPSVTVG